MEQHLLDAEQELQKEIQKEIKHRKTYESMDFASAHIFLWILILASFGASIIIASGIPTNNNKIVVAVIAGIPGLIVLIEKSFDFGKRALWGGMYRIELEELQDKLVFKKIEPFEASEKLREIKKRNELAFSRIGFFSPKKPEE